MKNQINIAELLKDCPKGMELNCLMYEDVYFDYVDELNIIHCYIQRETYKTSLTFNQHGTPNSDRASKCVIFPKDKTTWEGFQRSFMDGDVVATTEGLWIGIATGGEKGKFIPTYCVIKYDGEFAAYFDRKGEWVFNRLATEEEKAKLFQAIKDNGYYWNAETKTLEKLPKFKDGDILFVKAVYSWIIIYKESENGGELYKYVGTPGDTNYTFICYDCNPLCCKDDIFEIRLATEEEKKKLFAAIKEYGYKWNANTKTLERLIEPKFKVGDIIQNDGGCKVEIVVVNEEDEYYGTIVKGIGNIAFSEQDDWELAPNKFNISNLKAFDKVLVRDNNTQKWTADVFSFFDKSLVYPYSCVGHYTNQCIPYEGNEHLLGTINDCDEFFKTWE